MARLFPILSSVTISEKLSPTLWIDSKIQRLCCRSENDRSGHSPGTFRRWRREFCVTQLYHVTYVMRECKDVELWRELSSRRKSERGALDSLVLMERGHWPGGRNIFDVMSQCKFQLFWSDKVRYVRHLKGARMDPRHQVPTMKHGGRNVKISEVCSRFGPGPFNLEYTKYNFMLLDILRYATLPFAEEKMSLR